MRIAYLTTDEVNRDLAARAGRACRATLEDVPHEGTSADNGYDAVLYDLAHLPPHPGRAALDELFAGRLEIPTAVHGYGLEDGQADVLRDLGVIVARRLEIGLMERICLMVEFAPGETRR